VSTKQKALDKMRQNPRSVRFDEIDKVLNWYGFTRSQPGGGSSHYIYKVKVRGHKFRLTVAYHRPFMGQKAVRGVLTVLDELEALGVGFDT
jgi:hypothetical protein